MYNKSNLNIICAEPYIHINPNTAGVNDSLDAICSSQYVVSEDINYITIGNSYAIAGIFATLTKDISKYHKIISEDYYSNISNETVEPIKLNYTNNYLVINTEFSNQVNNFIQPVLPIDQNIIKKLVDIIPFTARYHKNFRIKNNFVQIIN